ncbi:MAG: hypothetical protein CL908_09190 [Deltaproteobacteria bacterium]|nr:hypothetical protein [Deltaproteobacteria bacterium]
MRSRRARPSRLRGPFAGAQARAGQDRKPPVVGRSRLTMGLLVMVQGSGAERRKYHRVGTDQVISFAELDEKDQLAVSKNLSTGGISFEAVGCEINLGEMLRVTFNVGDRTVVATGKVVWATDTDPITQEIGIEFHEIAPEAVRLLEEVTEPALEPVGLY